ncbi:aminoglycoside phosphotransferase family protein [Gottfriedia acidiceleris]|uniref:aminoglycoside phosphotransferase family protein n=1 Tax=Gottfriedia acidiceleris TaxID=371036 RepID=UPI002F25ED95
MIFRSRMFAFHGAKPEPPRQACGVSVFPHFPKIGSLVPKPIHFIELPEEALTIHAVESIVGIDGEEYLQIISKEQQYQLGIQAGNELLKIHSLANPEQHQSWKDVRLTKYNRYIDLLMESSISFPELDFILNFVEENKHLLSNRPITFLHDHFHPSNLLFKDEQLKSVIDFDRFEWGDPYHDFHKIALFTKEISIPFAIGQIAGYFSNNLPDDFWTLYALYAAMIIPSDIIWSYKTTPHLVDSMWKRVRTILDDHRNFNQVEPSWYNNKSSQYK